MSSIYGWVKNIVFFYIFITAVLQLLPKNNYRKYIHFFCGLLMVVVLLNPILKLITGSEDLIEEVFQESVLLEQRNMQLDTAGMEQVQKQLYTKAYEQAIAQDIAGMVPEEELVVKQVSVALGEDYSVEHIDMKLRFATEEQGIYIEKINFGDNSQEYPQVAELKKKILEYYELNSSQLQIVVQEEEA